MSIFKNIFSSNYDEEIKSITEFFQRKEFDTVIDRGLIIFEKLKGENQKTVAKLLALSHFNKKESSLALPYFEFVAQNSNNSDDWFNVTTTAILSKEVDKGMDAFSKAIQLFQANPNPNNIPIGLMSFYVMQAFKDTEEFDLAFVQLMKLKDVYCSLRITDDHFVHMRGLPFLGQLLEVSKTIIENQKIKDSGLWLKEFASGLDENGKMVVQKLATEISVGNKT
jgi:hypothetical protein